MKNQNYFIILGVLIFTCFGCYKRPGKDYYRNMNLCYSNLKVAYSELALGVISSNVESNVYQTAESNQKDQSFKCPVTNIRYAINPDQLKWKELQSTNAAIVCTVTHPNSISSERYYLIISFEGKLGKVTLLPSWAQGK
jgi:hypothetical protein